jgi:hypothetical protein
MARIAASSGAQSQERRDIIGNLLVAGADAGSCCPLALFLPDFHAVGDRRIIAALLQQPIVWKILARCSRSRPGNPSCAYLSGSFAGHAH